MRGRALRALGLCVGYSAGLWVFEQVLGPVGVLTFGLAGLAFVALPGTGRWIDGPEKLHVEIQRRGEVSQ